MHEMVFGFAIAVLIGFLLTAVRNWTGLWTPRGTNLGFLAGLWLAGRVAMLSADPLSAALVDMAFLPFAAWPLFNALRKSGNRRNMFMIVILCVMWLINGSFHAASMGWLKIAPVSAIHAAILLFVLIESLIGGRVIPGFTANAVPGTKPLVREPYDRLGLVLTVLACLSWILRAPAPMTAAFATSAGVAQMIRLIGWKAYRTLGNPLLWILHLSYAWLSLGFLLLAAAALGLLPASSAIHVLAIGAMSGMMIGMMTRTALGHTGRPLKAGRAELMMYLLVQGGAVTRFVASLNVGEYRNALLLLAASCWSLAFVTYLWVYGPYLASARVDGREG
jgi:uncharacterized protein involved in response to NO